MSLGRRATNRRMLQAAACAGLLAVGLLAATMAPATVAPDGDDAADGSTLALGSQSNPETDDDQAPATDDGTPALGLVGRDVNGAELACPAMTDSVNRLFNAYFNRDPDSAEFLDLATKYRTGQLNLETMSEQLSNSSEFADRYGTLTDDRFVGLVYRNTFRRPPTDTERQFWVNKLSTGHSRGAAMVEFSESADFVDRTGTATPLSGFLQWYPEGAHWYCGVGPRDDLSIKPLTDANLYADYAFFNGGSEDGRIGLTTVLGSNQHLVLTSGSLPPGFTSYKWSGLFDGDGNYGTALDIEAGTNTSWIVVFYPSPIGEQRLGWQIER